MLITGCRDTQMSADSHIGGTYNGALTCYVVELIKEAEGKRTYRELHQRTTAILKKNEFDQIPQLEGRAPLSLASFSARGAGATAAISSRALHAPQESVIERVTWDRCQYVQYDDLWAALR